jgi:phosphotransferase system enzyme I (PtsI)
VGRVFRIENVDIIPMDLPAASLNPDVQKARLQEAYVAVKNRLVTHAGDNEIFAAHVEILEDLSERIISEIETANKDAVQAIQDTRDEVCALFAAIDDDYLRARSDDIADVCRQLTAVLTGSSENPFLAMPDGSIVVADNLLPSDTILIDLAKLAGLALKKGSVNSHLAILAKSNAIPLVLGLGNALDDVLSGDTVVVDADAGKIITEPDGDLLEEMARDNVTTERTDPLPAITPEGIEISVYANAGSLSDVKQAIARGADGIGLLRTEFIFMQTTSFPGEDEQYNIYSACAKVCGDKVLTIRTLDIGADKQLPYHKMDAETNPVMGLRGIRFSLAFPAIFKVQLRAALRAAVHGNVRLMFPMITAVEEYNEAYALLEICKIELTEEGIKFDDTLRPGIMMETPASVLLADELASRASFFSIGTNDLTQYMLVVDREHPYADNACDSFHPAVIKSLEKIIDACEKQGIDLSLCGELASDPEATALLLDLGVRKLSVTSPSIHLIKEQIRNNI